MVRFVFSESHGQLSGFRNKVSYKRRDEVTVNEDNGWEGVHCQSATNAWDLFAQPSVGGKWDRLL